MELSHEDIQKRLLAASKQKQSEAIKDAFKERAISKLRTSFIFALSEAEHYFGYLWNDDEEDESRLNDNERKFRDLYFKFRKRVLDNGNNLIRNLDKELDLLDITLKRHSIRFEKRDNYEEG